MKANKTAPTRDSVEAYLAALANQKQRDDAIKLSRLMEAATGEKPVMWGSSIIGFGNNHYVYESGREGDTPAVGFAARKSALTLYGVISYLQNAENVTLAQKLGPHSLGKGCLYIKSLDDIDTDVLRRMIANAYRQNADKSD